ncbi:TKL family protein kinase [Tritrichomonas foetus]|uniref:TKL family protein kinase n=1 Tax=Tritrichomonas foetus TaxID=1144522 RepID=A0A1J4JTL4_9EUKA|nr:TKL family protein kinase [Tritrichomonas foetus]|eukprot:OHT02411.1 TKL family protein kinase [Tritrichomonas foetus]
MQNWSHFCGWNNLFKFEFLCGHKLFYSCFMNAVEILQKTNEIINRLFQLTQNAVVYKQSIMYLNGNIKSFFYSIQPLKNRGLTKMEIQSILNFNGFATHFATILPHLGKKWVNAALNWPTHHIYDYIDDFRKKIIKTCKELSIDPSIIVYDYSTDSLNKLTDLKQLKLALCEICESAISCQNSIDIQQLITARLNSINNYFSEHSSSKELPSVSQIPITKLKNRMDKELAAFTSISIPVDDLKLSEKLGSGGFGTVYKATRLSTGELLAVKEIRADKLSMSVWASLYSEVATMAPLKHPFVLELVGVHVKEPYRIITRYCSGKSLFDRLHQYPNANYTNKNNNNNTSTNNSINKDGMTNDGCLTASQLTKIAYQVAEGMMFLHANGIVHRDLKTMNILLDDGNVAKIADFGLAGMLKNNKELVGGVGTPHYSAPEVLERKRYGPKVDIYSYGMILWEMAMKQVPYRGKTHQAIYDQVVHKNWRPSFNKTVSEDMKRLITKCWNVNPNERPDFSEIVELFKKGKIYFEGADPLSAQDFINNHNNYSNSINNIANLNEHSHNNIQNNNYFGQEVIIPLDYEYIENVLNDPSSINYHHIANYLVTNLNNENRQRIRKLKFFSNPFLTNCSNIDCALILASVLLNSDEFPIFLEKYGNLMIKNIFTYSPASALKAVAKFFMKIPNEYFDLISDFIPQLVDQLVENISSPDIGIYIIRFLSRLDSQQLNKYQMQILLFFNKNGIDLIEEQADIDAFSKIFPIVQDYIKSEHISSLLRILKKNLTIPIDLINYLISNTEREQTNSLVCSLLTTAIQNDVGNSLLKILENLSNSDIEDLSKSEDIFEILFLLLQKRHNIKDALFLLFQLVQVSNVPSLLLNHEILEELLSIEGFIAMRLQIFASLYIDESFCQNSAYTDGVMKILVDALGKRTPLLIKTSLRFIGALSTHSSGTSLLNDSDLLQIFTQIFLSSPLANSPLSLQILINISRDSIQIPQASLIVSCLMQDLLYNSSNISLILITLRSIISISTNSVQEHDLMNSVMPYISKSFEPPIIVLAMQLFSACEMSTIRNLYISLIERIWIILSTPTILYPELILAAMDLIATISLQYDLKEFFQKTKLLEFLDYSEESFHESFPEIAKYLTNLKYTITTLSYSE